MADTTSDILAALDACGARVELHEGRLILHTGSQPVPSQLLARLRAAKGELTELLPLDPPPQEELLLPDPEVASSFHDNPPDLHEERNSAEDSVSCTPRSSCAADLAPSPVPYEVLGDAPAGERCALCGSGRSVERIRFGGEVHLWHPACADRYVASVAHPTVKPAETTSGPDDGATPVRAVAAPPSLPQTSDQVLLEPKHLASGQLLWGFAGGSATDVSPLALMTRARNHGAVLTRDGMTLIISSWSRLQPELVAALQRHSGTILQRLSRESATRIAQFERGEGGAVTAVLTFDPKPGGGE